MTIDLETEAEKEEDREQAIRDRINRLFKERTFPIDAKDVEVSELLDKIDRLRENIDHMHRLSLRDDEKIRNVEKKYRYSFSN